MREKWISALRVVMMAGLTALICGVVAVIGIADGPRDGQSYWGTLESLAVVSLLIAVVVLVCLLTLGQLYGYWFASQGWLSLRNTLLVGVIAQALLWVFVFTGPGPSSPDGYLLVHWTLLELFMPEKYAQWPEGSPYEQWLELHRQISAVAAWIEQALMTSPASLGLVLFYALHLRHKVAQPTALDQSVSQP